MRIFVLLVLFFSFLMSDSNEVFLKLDTGGHTGLIRDIIVTKDKKHFISASQDKTVRVWDINTGKEVKKFLGQIGNSVNGKIHGILLTPNEKYLIISVFFEKKGFTRFYDYKSGFLIKQVEQKEALSISLSSDEKLIVIPTINSVKIYDVNSLKMVLNLNSNDINSDIYNARIKKYKDDYYLISTGFFTKKLIIYSFKNKKIVNSIDVNFKISSLSIGQNEIAISGINNIKIYDFSLKEKKFIYDKDTTFIRLKYSMDGKYLVVSTSTYPYNIIIYNTNSYNEHIISDFHELVVAMTYIDNHKIILAGGENNKFIIYDLKKRQIFKTFFGKGERIRNIAISNNKIFIGQFTELFKNLKKTEIIPKIFDLKEKKVLGLKKYAIYFNKIMKNNPNFNYVDIFKKVYYETKKFVFEYDKNKSSNYLDIYAIKNKDNNTSILIKSLVGVDGHRTVMSFYKNKLLLGGEYGNLHIYNTLGEKIANLKGHESSISSIAFDNDLLISGGNDQIIKIWNLKKIEKLKPILNYQKLENIAYNEVKDMQTMLKNDEEKKIESFLGKDMSSFLINASDEGLKEFSKLLKKNDFLDLRKELAITANQNDYIDKFYTLTPLLNIFIFKNDRIELKKEYSDYNYTDYEYVMWTEDGYFNASSLNAIESIYFHQNQGQSKEAREIPMKRLYDHFFKPDFINMVLDGKDISKHTKGISYKIALQNPAPTIQIKKVDKKINKQKIKLSFNIKDNNGGIGLIRIYQEGKLIQTIGDGKVNKQSANIDTILKQEEDDKKNQENQKDEKMNEFLTKAKNGILDIKNTIAKHKNITTTNKAGEYEIELDLISGKNEIGIEAFNKTNTVTSYRESIVIDADILKKKPKLYAIVVGVDNFESNPKQNHLNYAEKDALSMQKEIETKIGKTFDGVEVKNLIGKNVTKSNILKSVYEIAKKAKLEDTIIFYISTHGRAVEGSLYFMPYNNGQGRDWIDFQQTFNAIQSIKALNQVFIVDACESGKANDIVSAVYDSRASVLAKSAGVHMLLATTKGAYAFEPNGENSNVLTFTQRVLKTLRDTSSDKNKDGFISIIELSKSLKEPQNSVEYQYPVIRNVGGDVLLRKVE